MRLSEQEADLIKRCTEGLLTILIAPKGQSFGSGQLRLMVDKGDISVVEKNGKILSSVVGVDEITKKLSQGEWEIREAFSMECVVFHKEVAVNVRPPQF